MSVTVDGLFSGLDTTAIVNALVDAQSGPRNAMQRQLEDDRATLSALSDFNNRLESLASAAATLQELSDKGYSATVPETAGFTAETGDGAIAGTYNISVTSLASSEMEVSQGYASRTDPLMGTGTMDVTVAGVTTTVNITSGALNDVALALDEVDGIQAYVLNTGGTDPFQLVVQSESTGAANTIVIDTSGLGGGTTPVFTEAQAGADAALTINGLAVTASSNNVKAVPGLTINLNEAGLGTSTIEVEIDETTISESLQAFVDSYNEVIDFQATRSNFNQSTGEGGPLFGDGTSRRIVDRIGTMVSSGYTTSTPLSILAEIGIQTQQLGTLGFDSSELSDAIARDFDDVIDFLTSDTGPLAVLQTEIEDLFVDPIEGAIKSRTASLEAGIRDLEDRIADEDDRLASQADTIRARFTRLESTLAELQSQTQFVSNLFPPTSS